jgi:hypothetical protein
MPGPGFPRSGLLESFGIGQPSQADLKNQLPEDIS